MSTTAQPSPTPTTSTFLSDMLDVFNVIHDPDAVFKRVSDRARIVAPWIVLSVAVIIISILMRPYQQAAFEAFKSTLSAEQAAKMGNRGAGGGPLGLIFTPVVVLGMFAAGAGVLWIAVSITGTQARYKTLFSVLAYSSITYVLFAVVGIAVLMVRGKAGITGFEDVRPPLGLDLVAPNAGLYLGGVLNGINPFSVWGVWLAGTGVAITHRISRSAAIGATAVAYVICLLIICVPYLFVAMMTKQ
ncbi:MAG TPA: YIP1 family protein [Gemmatimonadales bacterium]|nr:YIP1 family protein [Gemmatimonadales bacterium]